METASCARTRTSAPPLTTIARQTDSAPILKDRSHVLVMLDLPEMECSVPILTNVPMQIGVTPTQNAQTHRAHSPVLVMPDSREAGQTEIAQISTSAPPNRQVPRKRRVH